MTEQEVNELIEEYLSSKLEIHLSLSDDIHTESNGEWVYIRAEVELLIDGKSIRIDDDYCSFRVK